MIHYVPKEACANPTKSVSSGPGKTREIDVFISEFDTNSSTGMILEFYRALNDLLDGHSYSVTVRKVADNTAGSPLYWAGRTAIFWGDIHEQWNLSPKERSWVSQIFRLSPRTILVGGATLLLPQTGQEDLTEVALHPNFEAAAQESGLCHCGNGTYLANDGRIHSAATRLGALRLFSEFVSMDHGAFIAESLQNYVGLTETGARYQSLLAIRLIQRSGADPLVKRAVQTMQEHVEEPLRIPEISEALGTSTRQLQRRFQSKTGKKLLSTYRALRLERARNLLCHTDMSPLEISAATGFSSVTSMGRSFREQYRNSPEEVRTQRFKGRAT